MSVRDFPPLLEHPNVEFRSIMERKAYVVIFDQKLQHTKSCFEHVSIGVSEESKRTPIIGKDSNVVVTGWHGVSASFASLAVNKGLKDFEKIDGFRFILPTWTLEELQDSNSLLPSDMKLADDELVSRYRTFGGIPLFSQSIRETEGELETAITSFSALDIISYCEQNHAVKENNDSHRVLQMVPIEASSRAKFHLDYLSMHVAEAVVCV
ncbi:unnamed protein product [Phytophthora lilii]|uniref:Unnamed protein product n=1 Tax=Phytophthora lilii TaxID=2077276 RepID=A0A9W6TBL2_9STRA|nr:unnamed protein product [Phytophthora lilii]